MKPASRTTRIASLLALLPLMAACGATPPLAPDADEVDPPSTTGQNVRTGTFQGLAGHHGSGTVKVSMAGDTAIIEFQADFSSTQAPGPYVYLNTGTDANEGQPIRIAALASASGAQTYAAVVPTDVEYAYVLVWCDPFNVGIAAAKLES